MAQTVANIIQAHSPRSVPHLPGALGSHYTAQAVESPSSHRYVSWQPLGEQTSGNLQETLRLGLPVEFHTTLFLSQTPRMCSFTQPQDVVPPRAALLPRNCLLGRIHSTLHSEFRQKPEQEDSQS